MKRYGLERLWRHHDRPTAELKEVIKDRIWRQDWIRDVKAARAKGSMLENVFYTAAQTCNPGSGLRLRKSSKAFTALRATWTSPSCPNTHKATKFWLQPAPSGRCTSCGLPNTQAHVLFCMDNCVSLGEYHADAKLSEPLEEDRLIAHLRDLDEDGLKTFTELLAKL